MDLDLAASPIFLALCVTAAGLLSWWSYGHSTPMVGGWRRTLLTGLRFASLFVVLFLLFEPVWKSITRSTEPPLLAVLVDSSESLTLGTTGVTPSARVRAALDEMPTEAALRFYTFDGEARLRGTSLSPDSVSFGGERTDISAALGRIESDFAGRNLRGVVLVSDGRVTDGRNPVYLAERFPVPIHTATAGDSVSNRDVRLTRVITNDIAYAGSPLPIQAGVRATGFAGSESIVTVSEGGRVVAREPVTMPPDGAEIPIDLTVTPASAGVRRYTVTVVPLTGEATTRNNSQTVTVRVIDDKRRILIVAAAPSPDLAALRTVLEADKSLDTEVRTQRGPGAFYEGPLPASLGRYDLIVLVGYPGRAASASDIARIQNAATGGLPIFFLLTRQSDLARLGQTIGEALPATVAQVRAGAVEVGLAPTSAGEAHPVLSGLSVPVSRLGALPPVAATPSRWTPQPGSQTLASVRRGGTVLDSPLLMVRQNGGIRSAALLGAGTWRWRTLPDDLEDLRPVYSELMDRLIRWTTATRDRRPVRVRPDRQLFGERERVTFTGQVYGENLTPIEDAAIQLSVRAPGGATTNAPMRPIGNGRYTADIGIRPAGTYSYTAVATSGGLRLGDDSGSFSIGKLAVEFREPGADLSLMRQVALRSGGQVVRLDTLGAFISGLRERGLLDDRPLVREDATPLIKLPWLLALLVALLTAEWVLRKRTGMV